MSLRNVKFTGVEVAPGFQPNPYEKTKYRVHYHLTPIFPKAKHDGTFELYYDLRATDELDAWKVFKEHMRLHGREVVP